MIFTYMWFNQERKNKIRGEGYVSLPVKKIKLLSCFFQVRIKSMINLIFKKFNWHFSPKGNFNVLYT